MLPQCCRSRAQSVLVGIVACLLLVALTAHAYPFSRDAPVTEVTPTSFNDFVNSHKPVVMLFYAPWCGHCKNFEPEFIRFAETVKGTVRVGAINADAHSSFGQQFGVRGFPTIKYWKAGKKSVNAPQEYQGPRTAVALQQLITSDIPEDNVHTTVDSIAALETLVKSSPLKRVAALLSRKSKVPAMFSVLSLSRQLQTLPFVFIGGEGGAARTIQTSLGVTDLPAVTLIAWNETTEALQLVPYTRKKMMYEPIAKFFLSCTATATSDSDAPLCSAASAGTKPEGGKAQVLDEDAPNTATSTASSAPIQRAKTRPAFPVSAVPFTADALTTYCSPTSPKMGGAAPVCVVITSAKATDAELRTLYATFEHDPVIFFFAKTDEEQEAVKAFLSSTAQLTLVDAGVAAEAIAYRHAREGVLRYKRFSHFETIADDLQKVLSGDVRLDTQRLG